MGNTNHYKHTEYENLYDMECSITHAINVIGKKWKVPIILILSECDSIRYNELKRRAIGITNTMLIKCLQELEDSQLIVRFEYDTVPPKVEYSLTKRGQALLPILNELSTWGEEQMKI